MKRRSFISKLLGIAALPLIPISAIASKKSVAIPNGMKMLMDNADSRPPQSVYTEIKYRRWTPTKLGSELIYSSNDLSTATGEQQ